MAARFSGKAVIWVISVKPLKPLKRIIYDLTASLYLLIFFYDTMIVIVIKKYCIKTQY
jgi:hypothetical protein